MQKYLHLYANLKIWTQYAQICTNMQKNMQNFVTNMHLHAGSRQKYVNILQ